MEMTYIKQYHSFSIFYTHITAMRTPNTIDLFAILYPV